MNNRNAFQSDRESKAEVMGS